MKGDILDEESYLLEKIHFACVYILVDETINYVLFIAVYIE